MEELKISLDPNYMTLGELYALEKLLTRAAVAYQGTEFRELLSEAEITRLENALSDVRDTIEQLQPLNLTMDTRI